MANESTAAKAAPAVQPIHTERFGLEVEKHNRWSVTLEHNRPVEQVLDGAFLAHNARQIRAGDVIVARKEDSSYYAEFYVHDASVNHVRLELIFEKVLAAVKSRGSDIKGFKIAHGGLQEQWRVIREADNRVMKSRLATETDAIMWLQNHNRTLAAA